MPDGHTGKVHIDFVRSEGYALVPVTGAWGGVSPQREIIVDFYIDNRRNPDSIDVDVVDGRAATEQRHPSPEPIERIVHFGIVVRPDIARTIGEFLLERAKEASSAPAEK